MQISVLGADAGIIKAGRDGVYRRDLAVFILQEVGLHAVENAQATVSDSSGVFGIIHAEAGRFNANQAHILVLDKVVEHTHSVGATAYTGDEHIGQAAFLLQHLRLNFFANNLLEIAYDGGIRMRAHNTAQYIISILNALSPYAQSLVYSILQGAGAAFHGHDLGA